MDWQLYPGRTLRGRIVVPGDKSIAHRALMLAAVAEGPSHVSRVPAGADVTTTIGALRLLGVEIGGDRDRVRIVGSGLHGLRTPGTPIDCGNSGTTMRLLAGLLAGAGVEATLIGDRSLGRRPMARIAEPLRAMGASVQLVDDDYPPLQLRGGTLRAVTYRPPVASAQVKGCVLLAGLYADGITRVVEQTPTRDHTERLLRYLGAEDVGGPGVGIRGKCRLHGFSGSIPGDLSSAAYWVVAASVTGDSELELIDVGVNPSRRALLDLLRDWGADLTVMSRASMLGEPQAVLRVRSVPTLSGGAVDAGMAAALIDELPLLGLLAPLTRRGVEVRGATELRHKESDRIATTCAALRALDVRVDEYPDGFAVAGGQRLGGGTVDSHGDHRIVLSVAAVAGAAAGPIRIHDAGTAGVSYPEFLDDWQRLTA